MHASLSAVAKVLPSHLRSIKGGDSVPLDSVEHR